MEVEEISELAPEEGEGWSSGPSRGPDKMIPFPCLFVYFLWRAGEKEIGKLH